MDLVLKKMHLISAAIGEGAVDSGCKYGGQVLLETGIADSLRAVGRLVNGVTTVTSDALVAHDRMDLVARFSRTLAATCAELLRGGSQLLVLGGDHSCAIGTWSGVAKALSPQGSTALIWVDAHLDAHTPETSESKAPHGMPLAALLGHGSADLTEILGGPGKIQAHQLAVIGVRSYEPAERALLESLGVRIFYMEEVRQRGFEACFAEAKAAVTTDCAGWGVSFDLDGLDPSDAPATGTPVEHGIPLEQALAALKSCRGDPRFVGLEIAEYNPLKDFGGDSARAVHALAMAGLGRNATAS